MTMITPSYLGDTIEYSSYASSLVPSSDPLVTAASVLEFCRSLSIDGTMDARFSQPRRGGAP